MGAGTACSPEPSLSVGSSTWGVGVSSKVFTPANSSVISVVVPTLLSIGASAAGCVFSGVSA